jgi:hypothetical protein
VAFLNHCFYFFFSCTLQLLHLLIISIQTSNVELLKTVVGSGRVKGQNDKDFVDEWSADVFKQTWRPMEQNRRPRHESTKLYPPDFW